MAMPLNFWEPFCMDPSNQTRPGLLHWTQWTGPKPSTLFQQPLWPREPYSHSITKISMSAFEVSIVSFAKNLLWDVSPLLFQLRNSLSCLSCFEILA